MDRFLVQSLQSLSSAAAVLLACTCLLAASPTHAGRACTTVHGSGRADGSFRITECKDITNRSGYAVVRELCREHAVTTFHESGTTRYSSQDSIGTFATAVRRLETFRCLLEQPDEDLCHPQLRQYVCRMIFPRCFDLSHCILDEWWPDLDVPCLKVFPCRELCESVHDSCASCYQGGSWPEWAECRGPAPEHGIFFHNKAEAGRCEPLLPMASRSTASASVRGRRLRVKNQFDSKRCGKCKWNGNSLGLISRN